MEHPTSFKILTGHPVMKAIYRVSQEVETPIYLVGGAVRDLLMGILPEKDFDFVMRDNLIQSARLFSRISFGSFFPLSSDPPNYRVVLLHDDQRVEVDFSGFRGDDLCQDLSNRDFTVNAIALEVNALFQEEEIKLYDPLGGANDLQRKMLRLASPRSFDHDPLRILRAVRIAKERGLNIEAQTREAMCRQKNRLFSVSVERVRSEFFKILSFSDAKKSLSLLDELGLLSLLIPTTEVLEENAFGSPAHWPLEDYSLEVVSWCEWVLEHFGEFFPQSHDYVKTHFKEMVEEDVDRRSLLKFGGLLYNRGKTFSNKRKNVLLEEIIRNFKLGKRAGKILRKMLESYNKRPYPWEMEKPNPRVFFRFFQDMGSEGLEVILLWWADYVSRFPEKLEHQEDIVFRDSINCLVNYYFKEHPITKPLLSGRDVIEKFGLKEGKVVGDLLNQVARAEAQGLLCSPEKAFLYVENLLQQKRRDLVI